MGGIDGVRDEGSDRPPLVTLLTSKLVQEGLGPTQDAVAPEPDPQGRRLGAVLILIYPHSPDGLRDPTPHLVLTRRTELLPRHSGQISLPGGRFDPADGTLLRTALRETREELGVNPAGLAILGRLEPVAITVSHYLVAPFIAYAERRPEFHPAADEVAEVIEVPLSLLLDPSIVAEEIWEIRGEPRHVSFFRHGEHKIWGATARVLGQLVALLTPESEEHATARLQPGIVYPEGERSEMGG